MVLSANISFMLVKIAVLKSNPAELYVSMEFTKLPPSILQSYIFFYYLKQKEANISSSQLFLQGLHKI